MPLDLDPMHYDDLAEAGTIALRTLPGAVLLELERRTDLLIIRHMFLDMTVQEALRLQAALAAAILEAMQPPMRGNPELPDGGMSRR